MSCLQTIQDYGLRSLGYGERLLPREGSRFANSSR